jgi:opacity protein-like surface antigen
MTHLFRARWSLTLLLAAGPVHAQARQSPWMPSLGGGVTEWDSSTTRSATTIVMRGSRNILGRYVGFEWGGAYASFRESARLDPTQTLALDWRLAVQTPWQAVQPYAGVGPSLFMYGTNSRGRRKFEPGYNVGAGARVQVTAGLSLVLDWRVRAWDFDDAGDPTLHKADEITLSFGFRR